ncbi:MAG: sigma-70 family RNA polymerase sigma factor [Myxococcota bacterium]|nr:sigma-70 family RNA polymerase sigma factor [Myxococcota bacterium]
MSDDRSLLAASQAGDVTAFGQLIERYHNLVCAIAYARTGDRVASEDIAQETFLAAWRGVHGLRDSDKLRSWLCGIARNLASKSLRHRKHDDISEHEGQLAGDAGPLDAMLTKELEATVWAALSQLPETYREPLVLFYREQQSIKDVALGLGLSEETAKQRLSRGRQQLRENVGDLVEKTLHAGRPRKAAAAAVLAAIIAMRPPAALAAARTIQRTNTGRRAALAAGAGALCIAAAIVVFTRSPDDAKVTAQADPTVTELRRAHDVWRASHPTIQACELGGTVTRGDGTPIAGALVAVLANSWQGASLEPVIVESDANGRWRAPLLTGAFTVSISARGHRAQSYVTSCVAAGAGMTASVLATGGGTLRGSISDSGGGPIAATTVWLVDPQRPSELFVARSGSDGTYELTAAPGLYMALFVHPEYTLDVLPITLGEAGAREATTLLPGGVIEGVVVDRQGAPIAGAKVSPLPPPAQLGEDTPLRWQMASIYGALLPVTADANGQFVIRGLAPGKASLVARSPAFVSAPVDVTLTLAETRSNVTLTADAARTVSGFVVARGQRSGLAGAQVIAAREDTVIAMPVIATSDGAGHFELTGLAPGPYRVSAVGNGYVPEVSAEPIVVADRDVTDTVLTLERGVTLRGRAEPRAHVKLLPAPSAMSTVGYLRAVMTRAEVDDRGNFTFAAVAPGEYVVSATTFDRRGERAVRIGSAPIVVELALEARPQITGVVVDDKGTKLPGVLVAATPARNADPFAASHTTVRTDESGAFRIVAVSPGRHQLRVFDANGQRPWATGKRPFEGKRIMVPASGAVTETLTVASGGGRISGVVVGVDQRPIADAWIEVRARGARHSPGLFPSPPILTDARGRFSIDGVFGGELVVEASGPDGKQRAVALAAPGAQLTLELRPMSILSAVVTRDGQPVPAFDARLTHVATRASRAASGAAGALSIPAIAGDHELVITSDQGYARRPIAIGATTSDLEIALTPWSSVRGRVVGADGAPWADATLLVHESVEHMRARTDSAGNFTLDRMIAGKNQLSIMHATDRDDLTMLELDLAPGQRLDLGTIEARNQPQTTASTSTDLGLSFYVSTTPPTPSQLAAVANDPMAASRGGSDPDAALWIASVTVNSPAARAGLRTGDRVVGVGMSSVESGKSAVDMMMSLATPWRSKGRAITWTVRRGGRELKLDVLVPE